MLKRRQEDIKAKGFNLLSQGVTRYQEAEDEEILGYDTVDYSKMRVGLRTVDDALINLGIYKKINRNYGDKKFVLNAIYKHDYKTLREISDYFYESSGIYYRLCKYLAFLYRFDWYVTPYMVDASKDKEKLLKDFSKVLLYLDKSNVKRMFGNIALDIIKEGAYYGIIVDFGDRFAI